MAAHGSHGSGEPMKGLSPHRSGFTVLEMLIAMLVCGVLSAFLFGTIARKKSRAQAESCQGNLRHIGLAVMQYSQDHARHFPRIISNHDPTRLPTGRDSDWHPGSHVRPFGWADALEPYLSGSYRMFQCPADRNPLNSQHDSTLRNFTDYYLNRNLSGIKQEQVNDPAMVILCGEGNDGRDKSDARYALQWIPRRWMQDTRSPAYRHQGQGNYLFADGHVVSLPPEAISTSNPQLSREATFAPR
jgi:prepilin-type processing-associated H-X9-DG protein/prepilin-type N-terminal cleavage/methylation domain-containing protein